MPVSYWNRRQSVLFLCEPAACSSPSTLGCVCVCVWVCARTWRLSCVGVQTASVSLAPSVRRRLTEGGMSGPGRGGDRHPARHASQLCLGRPVCTAASLACRSLCQLSRLSRPRPSDVAISYRSVVYFYDPRGRGIARFSLSARCAWLVLTIFLNLIMCNFALCDGATTHAFQYTVYAVSVVCVKL